MPNIEPEAIKNLINYMDLDKCEIGTLASHISSDAELEDQNIVKVLVKDKMKPGMFVEALDFIRTYPTKDLIPFHHIGIYAFTNKALIKYVSLKRSKLELSRKLEQLRAIDNGIKIDMFKIDRFDSFGIDTEEDLLKFKEFISS